MCPSRQKKPAPNADPAAMRELGGSELLDIWDTGQHASPMQRAYRLLHAAWPDEDIAAWSLGRANAGLLAMRRRWLGDHWRCLSDCPACGEVIEVALRVDQLLGAVDEGGMDQVQALQRIDEEGWSLAFRLPHVGDLLELACQAGDTRWLWSRVLIEARADDKHSSLDDIPASALRAAGRQIEQADPLASIELAMACPDCGHAWSEPLHVIDVFWSELSALAERLLSEVGRLAQSFGWSEAQILAMTPQRRQRYLNWLGA